MANPNISVRRYIRWLPAQPEEPTSTLVLTSGSGKFVDIRIRTSEPFRSAESQSHDSPELPLSRLEWGFAGTSIRTQAHEKDGNLVPTHAQWYHTIDSKSRLDADPPMDEGDMYPQSNGEELEVGRMINPETGLLAEYEEMWYDVEVKPEAKGQRVCVVLTHEGANGRSRGMVMRIGQWCQGIFKEEENLCIERWKLSDEIWSNMARFGNEILPCNHTFTPDNLITGNMVSDWFVDEVTYW